MASRILLYLKGICMGIADVIPGVSGGTMALILGIYEKLIDSLRSIDADLLRALWACVRTPNAENRERLVDELLDLNVLFLLVLGAGIVTAVVLGSLVVPPLLADYPVSVRGFFFGLILGSVWIPYTMLRSRDVGPLLVSVVFLLVFLAAGYALTGPDLRLQGSYTWVTSESEGEPLVDVLHQTSSALPPQRVLLHERNEDIRAELSSANPNFRNLLENVESRSLVGGHSEENGPLGDAFESLRVPKGVTVEVPTIGYPFLFFAGFVGISAMVLPGISGSYILLILGTYFYVTFSLKSFLSMLAGGIFAVRPFLIVVVFVAGLISGVLVLARVLGYLLDHYRAGTVGALTGLMLGCLRGVWPYREVREGVVVNVVPETMTPTVENGLLFLGLGFVVVVSLSFVGSLEEDRGARPESR